MNKILIKMESKFKFKIRRTKTQMMDKSNNKKCLRWMKKHFSHQFALRLSIT